jgi:hypothetical protein
MPEHKRATDAENDAVVIKPKTVGIFGLIVSTVAILVGVGISWGETHNEIGNLQKQYAQTDANLQALAKELHDHQATADIHMDKSFKEDMLRRMDGLTNLLVEHMGVKLPRRAVDPSGR